MGETANIAEEIILRTTDRRKLDIEFSKGIFDNIFFKNLEGLLEKSEVVIFNDPKWEQNPHKFSLDYYGEVSYCNVIMLVNNVASMFSFKSENFKDFKIYVPLRREILKVLSYVKI